MNPKNTFGAWIAMTKEQIFQWDVLETELQKSRMEPLAPVWGWTSAIKKDDA